MDTDFITNLASKAASDLVRFSVEFPLFIISFVVVLLIVTLVFRRKRELSFSEMTANESEKHTKQVLKNLKREKLVDAINLDMAGLIGADAYVYFDIDFLFDFLMEPGQEIEFQEQEKKIRKYIHKNENGMAQFFKKNIVEIYLKVEDKKSTQISFFHMYFFATEFSNFVDINLDGNFLLDTKYFTINDIVNVFENREKKFNFEEYFYYVIGRINEHVLDMRTYMKTKEIFSTQISQFLRVAELQQKVDIKLKITKDEKPKVKDIYYQFKKKNRAPIEPTKIEDVMPIITDENDIRNEVVEISKDEKAIDVKPVQEVKKVSEQNPQKKTQKKVRPTKNEAIKNDANKPFIKDGKYTSKNQENKKDARKDIYNQKVIVSELENESFETEAEVSKVSEEHVVDVEKINNLAQAIQIEDEKNKKEVSKEDEKPETEFATSRNIQKKQFIPMKDFTILLKKVHEDNVVKETFLFFKKDGNIYISAQYLFIKISMNYKQEDILNSFSMKFVNWLIESLKIINRGKDLEYKNINILIKKIEKQAGSIFIIFPENILRSKFNEEFFKKMPNLKEIKKYEHDRIDLVDYLQTRMQNENK